MAYVQIIIQPSFKTGKSSFSTSELFTAYILRKKELIYAGEASTLEEVKNIALSFVNKEFSNGAASKILKAEEITFLIQGASFVAGILQITFLIRRLQNLIPSSETPFRNC